MGYKGEISMRRKDYRSWIITMICADVYNTIEKDYGISDPEPLDCIIEQLWAVREGLA